MGRSEICTNRASGAPESALKNKDSRERQLTVSVIICTKDRTQECLKALTSACEQTVQPSEIIVVDGSSTRELEQLARSTSVSYGVPCYYLKTRPQLTYQRNCAISRMTGSVGLFIDDDVILDNDYIEKILEVYANEPDVSGVAGIVRNVDPPSWITTLRKLFLLWHRYGNGRMRISGYGSFLFGARGPQEVEIFEGCNMSYRKKILHRFSFDEQILTPAFNEDIDFSYRVSRRHKLIQTPFATLLHLYSSCERLGLSRHWENVIYWHYYFFRKNMAKTYANIIAYMWSGVGDLLGAAKNAFVARTIAPLIGVIRGYMRILGIVGTKASDRPV